jgi:type I restriction enzyme, S subunit
VTAYLGAKLALLQDLVFLQRGFDITKAEQKEGDIPVISSSGPSSWHNEAMAEGPGVVIGRKGTLGSVHYSAGDYWPHDTTLWSKSLNGNNPRFVYYPLKCLGLERFNVGGANPTLNRNHIHGLPIHLADRGTQNDIVSILSAYDDLIENNRRRIALLEEAARMLYREWFVRFRFAGHEHVKMIDGIPEGWQWRALDQVVEVVSEIVKPQNFEEDDVHIGLEHIPRRSFTLSDWEPTDGLASHKIGFVEGDILFGKIRPYFHKVGFALCDGVASSDALGLARAEQQRLAFGRMCDIE